MNVTNDERENATIAHFEGNLNTGTAPEAQAHLDALVDAGNSVIIVDLSGVDFVSSAGLRVLLATAKRMSPAGVVRLCGLNPSVQEVFDVSGFSTIFSIFDDETAALTG